MANPANVALYGHRTQLWLENTTTGSEAAIDRVQNIEPAQTIRTEAYYELARKGKVGSTQHPPEFRIPFQMNMVNNYEAEHILAGKSLTAGAAVQYNMGDILTYNSLLTAWALTLNNDSTVLEEQEYTGCSVEEIAYRFTINGAIMTDVTLIGKSGKIYTSSFPHTAFGALDDTSLGGIHGKDARIWLTSGSSQSTMAFRLQNFTIRARFPSVFVRELGNRTLAGTLSDDPDVTIDFDLLKADSQPAEKFFTTTSPYYDLQNPVAAFNAYVRVFDPRDAEGLTTLKMFKIENVLPTQVTHIRAQVRGLSTARYSLTMSKEATANSGGLIVSNRNDL